MTTTTTRPDWIDDMIEGGLIRNGYADEYGVCLEFYPALDPPSPVKLLMLRTAIRGLCPPPTEEVKI